MFKFNRQVTLALAAAAMLAGVATQSTEAAAFHPSKPVIAHSPSLARLVDRPRPPSSSPPRLVAQPRKPAPAPSSLARLVGRHPNLAQLACVAGGGSWVYTCTSYAPPTQPNQLVGPCTQQGWTCEHPANIQ